MIVLIMLITQSHSKRLCRRVVFRAHALVNMSNVALPALQSLIERQEIEAELADLEIKRLAAEKRKEEVLEKAKNPLKRKPAVKLPNAKKMKLPKKTAKKPAKKKMKTLFSFFSRKS